MQPKIITNITDEIKEKITKSYSIALFVGAGISVSSGIPTFRGAGRDKYFHKQNPVYLSSIKGLAQFPELAWKYYIYLYSLVKEAKPNPAHYALVGFQEAIAKRRVVKLVTLTTNFDGLINKAGGQAVELHGNISKAICLTCKKTYEMCELDLTNLPPLCECKNILIPNIVLVDDLIKKEHYDLAVNASRGCTVYISIGTSGVSSHAYGLMKSVRLRPNTTLIEINPRFSYLTTDQHYFIQNNAEDVLGSLCS
jgi:NAD-dependent deacetylase